jgi:glycosyltransferase involved in cell wall biosynthesis
MANTPLKIVYITPAIYSAGGVERVITLKASYFAEQYGYDVTIIVTEGKGRDSFFPLSDKVKVVNLAINFEELWTCSFIRKVFIYLKKQHLFKQLLSQKLLRIRPDITISTLRREINFLNDIPDGSKKIGELHVNRANYRNFKTEKSNYLKDLFAKLWANNLVGHLKKLDKLVVLTKEDCLAWPELKNTCVIPDPLPFTPSQVSPLTEKRVIAVARYSHEKGIDLLLQAWAEVEKQCADWRLDVFGEGDTVSYEHLIDELAIDRSRCKLNGCTNEIEHEYQKSSVAVCSSRFEGFGLAIVEAMACGLPVVSFDCLWGPHEIITNGENGLLVENGNIIKMADAINILIRNKKYREQIGKKSVVSVQQYNRSQIVQKWNDLFKKIIET